MCKVIVPVILPVEYCEGLRNVEVEKAEWWEGPDLVVEAIGES